MRKFAVDAVALAIIAALVMCFFFRLFFPVPQLIVTPDFGRSDSWHFSFATKYVLGQSLHRGELPLWSSTMGGGFPLIGEGQIGAFYLPNLILFRLFDPVVAYNMALVFAIVSVGWGMYMWLRFMRYTCLPSLFAATTLSFSGMVIAQLPHVALIQGLSFLPWVAAATLYLARNIRREMNFATTKAITLWALVVSQQILTGFPQASFITLLFSAVYYGWLIKKNPTKLADAGRFLAAIVATAGLSAVQLLPSWEFLKQTTAAAGLEPEAAIYFSYPIKHLITLIAPFALGNPKVGTYPAFFRFDGSIFWENVGGIAPFPIILFFAFLLAYYTRRLEMKLHIFFLLALLASFLLMLGKYSPLYLIYSFFPFNLFRVPSRFIWIFVPVILILAAEGWTRLWQVKTYRTGIRAALVAAAALNTIFLINSWYSYHAIEPAANWLVPPKIIEALPAGARIRSVGAEAVHNQAFIPYGWQTTHQYRFLRSALAPNSNVYWNIPQSAVYAGRFLKRPTLLDALISQELTFDEYAATVSSLGKKLLDISSVDTLIASLPLTQTGMKPLISTSAAGITITAWRNPTSVPRAYLATKPILATTKEQAYATIVREDFIPGENVLVETEVAQPAIMQGGTANVSLTQFRDTDVIASITGSADNAILVLTDTYYPGWSATLNGKQVPIFPVNIQHMGVAIPQGDHVVRFRYTPTSFVVGAWISAITLIFLMGLWVFPLFSSRFHTRQKVLLRGARLRRSHGR